MVTPEHGNPIDIFDEKQDKVFEINWTMTQKSNKKRAW